MGHKKTWSPKKTLSFPSPSDLPFSWESNPFEIPDPDFIQIKTVCAKNYYPFASSINPVFQKGIPKADPIKTHTQLNWFAVQIPERTFRFFFLPSATTAPAWVCSWTWARVRKMQPIDASCESRSRDFAKREGIGEIYCQSFLPSREENRYWFFPLFARDVPRINDSEWR